MQALKSVSKSWDEVSAFLHASQWVHLSAWQPPHSGLPHGHGLKFWSFFFYINFGNLISMVSNLQIQNFTQFWQLLSKLRGFLYRITLIFHEINQHFDQFSKSHNYRTQHDNDEILFLNEPWYVKLWNIIRKARKKWKSSWLFLN